MSLSVFEWDMQICSVYMEQKCADVIVNSVEERTKIVRSNVLCLVLSIQLIVLSSCRIFHFLLRLCFVIVSWIRIFPLYKARLSNFTYKNTIPLGKDILFLILSFETIQYIQRTEQIKTMTSYHYIRCVVNSLLFYSPYALLLLCSSNNTMKVKGE